MRAPPLCGLMLPLLLAAGPANAALFWNSGVHSNDITVCFVGDSFANNVVFALQIVEYMQEFEWYSGIEFTHINGGVCPPAVPHPSDPSKDYYAGTIRIILPGVTTVSPFGWVPGAGCPPDTNWLNPDGTYNGDNDGWGSWANPPNDLEWRRSCVYNVKLGDDGDTSGIPWRNHTLHEIGHALGLSHEHERTDVDPSCTAPGFGGSASSTFMTPYDRDSVMNYEFLTCGIHGNYGHSGLSAWDRLAIHILYPERSPIAELRGNLLIRAGDDLDLVSAWLSRGAYTFNVASNFQWLIDGSLVAVGPSLSTTLSTPGVRIVQFSYNDSLVTVPSRFYSFTTTVRVVTADVYDRLIAALSNIDTLYKSTGMQDADGDGVPDIQDNCLAQSNSTQTDADGDGIGNACDSDIAIPNDCFVNFLDLNVMEAAFFSAPGNPGWNPDADFNSDGIVNFPDLLVMKTQFFGPPGPSATGCN